MEEIFKFETGSKITLVVNENRTSVSFFRSFGSIAIIYNQGPSV